MLGQHGPLSLEGRLPAPFRARVAESTYQKTPQAAEDRPPGPLTIMRRENARANLRRETQKNAFRSSVAPRTSLVTILPYVPREYMSGNSKTRETALNGPVVDREARGEIP